MINNNLTKQQQTSQILCLYILIANNYSIEYDATNREIELNVDVDICKKFFVKSNKNELPILECQVNVFTRA